MNLCTAQVYDIQTSLSTSLHPRNFCVLQSHIDVSKLQHFEPYLYSIKHFKISTDLMIIWFISLTSDIGTLRRNYSKNFKGSS
ncbi:hypothetical protein Trydic_g19995 [Trypoxylus dichotomus]